MRYLLSFLIISFSVSAQNVEILLIGASHNYANYPQQDFSDIQNKIKKFKPTAFFGEFLSKEDERLVMDYWCKQDNIKRLHTIKNNTNIAFRDLPKMLECIKDRVRLFPYDYRLKVDLASLYYLNQDVSNGHYQFWQVIDYLRQKHDIELENYVTKVLSPQSDITGRSMKRLQTSEYALIAFPLMLEMKIEELMPMDCQDFDLNWSASALAFYNKFELFKSDTKAPYAAELKLLMDKRDNGFKKYASIENNSKKVTEWLNTDEAAFISSSGDFYFDEFYDMDNFPKQEMLSQIHWWMMRNTKMCENVVTKARASGFKKVVVMVGANHRIFMQKIFNKISDVRVININDF